MASVSHQSIEIEKKLSRLTNINFYLQIFWIIILFINNIFEYSLSINYSEEINRLICFYAFIFSFIINRIYAYNVRKIEKSQNLSKKEARMINKNWNAIFINLYLIWAVSFLMLLKFAGT